MNNREFKNLKKKTIYPTVNALRKAIPLKSIKCISDTADSIYYELGEYAPEIHCRTGVPSFHLDYQGDSIKLTVNENVRMAIPIENLTANWLKAELCQWLSYECSKRRRAVGKNALPYLSRLVRPAEDRESP